MIKQALLVLVLLLSAHAVSHARLPTVLGFIFTLNWAYQHQMQLHEMQQRALAAALEKPEKDIKDKYPPITFAGASLQLCKDSADALQQLVISISKGDGPFNHFKNNDTPPKKESKED